MNTQTEVIEKLNALLAYSVETDSEYSAVYTSLMQPMLTAVNNYFTADRSAFKIPINNLEHAFYNDILKRETVASKIDLPMATNYPAAYSDLRKLFYSFSCMNVSNAAFHNAWVYEMDVSTQTQTVTHNTLIDSWVADLSTAISDELDNIGALYSWLETAASDAGMVMLWEDIGEILKQPNTGDIAQNIFIDKHLKECITTLNLTAYKPTYI